MKSKIHLRSVALTIILSIFSFSFFTLNAAEEERDVNGFSKVNLAIPGTLYLEQGNSFSLKLVGDQKDLDEIITKVDGEKLIIKTNRKMNQSGFKNVKIYLTMPKIKGASISGSGDLISENGIKTDAG